MRVTSLELCTVAGVAAFVALSWTPTVLFLGWQRGARGINFSALGNSSCDYTLPTNLSVVFANASPQARLFLISVAGGREVVLFSAVQLRKAFSILDTDEFPLPENLTLSLEQVSGLRRLLASTSQSIILEDENVTCNKDMTVDEERHCCYFSCRRWKWLDDSFIAADDVFFCINLVFGIISLLLTAVLTAKAKSERKFPLLTTAWYILPCVIIPTLIEAVGRLVGRNKTICCGKDDLFQVLDKNDCLYAIFYGIVQQWLYLAAGFWLACGFTDLWFILALLKGDVFDRWSKQIHVAQFIGVWTLSGLIALIPLFAKGTSVYSNVFLAFTSFGATGDLGYYTAPLPLTLAMEPLAFLLPHLVYTLQKRNIQRKALMAAQGTRSAVHVRQLKDVERRFLNLTILLFFIFLILLIRHVIDFAVSRSINFDEVVKEYVTCAMLNQKTNCEKALPLQKLLYASSVLQRIVILACLLSITYYLGFDKNVRAVWNKWSCRGLGTNTRLRGTNTNVDTNVSSRETNKELRTTKL